MKNSLTFAWVGLAVITFIGGLASLGMMAGKDDGLLSGLAMRGVYMITLPLTLVTTGLIYRFMLSRAPSSGVGIVGIIHLVISLIGTLVFIGAWVYQSLAMTGATDNFQTMGILFGVSGAFSLLSAIFFLIAVLIALSTRPEENIAALYD